MRHIDRAKKKAKAKVIAKMMSGVLSSRGKKQVVKRMIHELS